jgi:hypothetical protein
MTNVQLVALLAVINFACIILFMIFKFIILPTVYYYILFVTELEPLEIFSNDIIYDLCAGVLSGIVGLFLIKYIFKKSKKPFEKLILTTWLSGACQILSLFIIAAPIWDGRLVSETLPSLIIELSIFGLIAFIAAWKFKYKNSNDGDEPDR